MFAHQRQRIQLLLAFTDALLTLLAFEAAYVTRTRLSLERVFFFPFETHILLLVFCAVVWAWLGSAMRIYESLDSGTTRQVVRRTFRQTIFGTALLVLFHYLLRPDPPMSRSFVTLFFFYNLFLLELFRWCSPGLIGAYQRGFGTPYHLVIVGGQEKASKLARMLKEGSLFRIEITAQLSEDECAHKLPTLLDERIVDEVIFHVDSSKLAALEEVFLQCDEEGVRTRVSVDFFPHVNSDISFDRVGDAPLLTFSAAPLDDVRLLLKRFFDIVISTAGLILLSPLFAVVAVLIKITSPGPVVYRQDRCGLNGRKFTMYKLRSMVQNADELKADLEHLSERDIAFKIPHDPRVTPIGRWIRKFSIDELPQLWNVLRGDMSIVGPRPPVPEEVARYERWQRRRLRMRPGLTCLWAVSGRDHIDFISWMKMDICYIENWSLKLDWSIILRTIPHVLAGKGAH
ncbi:MAG: sugar transferase [Acidobacteriaceae bacterium]|nr:sugar transferase [Acidobacteriaceae bacterium]